MNISTPLEPKRGKKHLGPISALFNAIADSRTPFYAKALPILVLLYAVFPFDLIPDVIPFAGWIDDLLIVPAGIWLAMRYIPQEVLAETGAELAMTIKKFKRNILLVGIALAIACLVISIGIIAVLFLVIRKHV